MCYRKGNTIYIIIIVTIINADMANRDKVLQLWPDKSSNIIKLEEYGTTTIISIKKKNHYALGSSIWITKNGKDVEQTNSENY